MRDRKATAVMVSGALIGVAYRSENLVPQPARSGEQRAGLISAFVFALLMLLLSGWRYRGRDYPAISSAIGGLSALLQRPGADRRAANRWLLVGRPITSVIARANILLFFCGVRLLFRRELCVDRADHRRRDTIFASDRSASTASASGSARRCSAAAARRCSASSAMS